MKRIKLAVSLAAAVAVAVFFVLAGGGVFANPPAANNSAGAAAKLQVARKNLDEAKQELGKKYDCCIKPACDFCGLAAGKCPCAGNLSKGMAVCGNCYDGWQAGLGHIKGINPANIKRLSSEQAKMMFKMRSMGGMMK